MTADPSQRLESLRLQLLAVHEAGRLLSAASKGAERELFVELVLRNVLPPHVRLGPGDIVDSSGSSSGQVDIVVEAAMSLSFPSTVVSGPRLYLAEGVVAAIEVKSDLGREWKEIERKVKALKQLRRRNSLERPLTLLEGLKKVESIRPGDQQISQAIQELEREVASHPNYRGDIPIFVVGFKGWKRLETLVGRATELDADGVVCLDPPMAHYRDGLVDHPGGVRDTTVTRSYQGADVLLYLLHVVAENWRRDVGEVAQDLRPYLQNKTILDQHMIIMPPTSPPENKAGD